MPGADSITGPDGPVTVVLGIGVLLVFAGILIRAVATLGRPRNRRPSSPAIIPWLGRRVRRDASRAPDSSAPCAAPDSASERASPATDGDGARPPATASSSPATPAWGERPAALGPERPEPGPARISAPSLAPLGGTLDDSRRLRAAEARVADELAQLPRGEWLIERDVLIGDRRIPFLVLGDTGVFVICATDGAWNLRDLHRMSALGARVLQLLPDYDGPAHAAACLAFDHMAPRSWNDEHGGGWVLGLQWLRRWMLGFGPKHGLRTGDLTHLNAAAGPFWDRRSTARLPATRNRG
jgi:hypothetical protein